MKNSHENRSMNNNSLRDGTDIRKRILFPLMLTLIFLLASFTAGELWLQQKALEEDAEKQFRVANELFAKQIISDVEVIKKDTNLLINNVQIQRAFLSKNRKELLDLVSPLFKELQRVDQISHFYFHDEAGVNFLRVHKPDFYGDIIDRKTMQDSLKSGGGGSGIELGPLGTFTLRVVSPWRVDNVVIGYIEMGKDSKVYMERLKNVLNAESYLFISKTTALSNRAQWERRMKRAGKSFAWDRFGAYVLVEQSTKKVPAVFSKIFAEEEHPALSKNDITRLNGKHYHIGVIPIHDVTGKEIGDLALLIDITGHYNVLRTTLTSISIISAVTGIALIMFFYMILGRVERRLKLSRRMEIVIAEDKIKEKVREEYIGQIEKQNEELKLRTEQLADAREAALNMMEDANEARMAAEIAENKVRASEVRLAKAQQIAHIGNWEWEIETDNLIWSDEVFRTFGLEPQVFEPTYQVFLNTIHPEDRDIVASYVAKALKKEESYSIDHRVVLPDGSERIVHEQGEVQCDKDGKMTKMLGTVQDITERKEAEYALIDAKKAADVASKAKSEFLANMSHEIRTPMTTILGMSELLSETELDNEQEEYLNGLQKAGDNLIALVNDILDLSKIEAGMIDLEEVEFDLDEEIEKVTGIFDIRAREKGIEMITAIDPVIPSLLLGDPVRLRQVLINLVGNGVKFTEKGEIKVSVACEKPSECSEECRLTFSVSDTGIGIPSEKLEAIFEDFTQADSSTTRTFGGTGLGLTISKKLVEIMGGKIWVESKMGEGSTFHFNLNMKVETEKGEVTRKKEKPEGKAKDVPARDSAKKVNMLVVDDSEDNRLLVETFLKKSPYNVDMAEDGEIALQMFISGEYDIILMDMQMPVMDGYTATTEIRKWEKENGRDETPIIAFTAHALKEEVDKCLEAGCTDHIAKPVKKGEILGIISKFLGSEKNE